MFSELEGHLAYEGVIVFRHEAEQCAPQWTRSPGHPTRTPGRPQTLSLGCPIHPRLTGHPCAQSPVSRVSHLFTLHTAMHFSFSLGFEMFRNKKKQNKMGPFFIWLIECNIQYVAVGKMSPSWTVNSITQNKSLHLLSVWIGFPNGSNIYRNGPNCTNKPWV